MAEPPPAPFPFPSLFADGPVQLQQYRRAIAIAALIFAAWVVLSDLQRCLVRWKLHRHNINAPPSLIRDISDNEEASSSMEASAGSSDEQPVVSPGPALVKAESPDAEIAFPAPCKRKQSITPYRRCRRIYYSPSPTISDAEDSKDFVPNAGVTHTKPCVQGNPLTPHSTSTGATPRAGLTPTTLRLASIPLPAPSFPHSPYIRLSPSPPPPPTLTPGTFVLRPQPTHFPTDPRTHDGPFLLLSTANPAPPHLAHTQGAELASWAEIELPLGSTAERWYRETELVEYTGSLMKERIGKRVQAKSGTYVIELLRGDRVRHGKIEYRVAWRGWPCEDDTWEPARKVRNVNRGLVAEYEMRKRK